MLTSQVSDTHCQEETERGFFSFLTFLQGNTATEKNFKLVKIDQ